MERRLYLSGFMARKFRKFRKFRFKRDRFFSRYVFWLLCIPINALPIFLKAFSSLPVNENNGLLYLLHVCMMDLDFMFISLNACFVLVVEGFFVENELATVYRKVMLFVFISTIIMIVVYICFRLRPEVYDSIDEGMRIAWNLIILMVTFVLGTICNIILCFERDHN